MHRQRLCSKTIVSVLCLILVGGEFTCALSQAIPAESAPAPTGTVCRLKSYVVLTSSAIGITCLNAHPFIPDGAFELDYFPTPTTSQPVAAEIHVFRNSLIGNMILVYWPPSATNKLQPNRSYELTLGYANGGSAAASLPLTIPIDTSGAITVVGTLIANRPQFTISSTVAFSTANGKIAIHDPAQADSEPCTIHVRSGINQTIPFQAKCAKLDGTIPIDTTDTNALGTLNFTRAASSSLLLPSFPNIGVIPSTMPFSNVLGVVPQFDPKSRFLRPTAPATKDASQLYLNGNYTAGVGAKPAWVVDAKIAPVVRFVGRYAIGPLLTANVGNGSIQGQTATDTIDLGGTISTFYRPESFFIDPQQFTAGLKYETDRHFDRHNLLGTFNWLMYIRSVNHTQQMQQAAAWAAQLSGGNPKAQLSDISLFQFWGHEFDVGIGAEGGGAVVTHVITASSGGAEEVLPQYPIFRIVPQLHLLLQKSRVSLDDLVVGRYLTTTEKTIVETPSHSLYLASITGWRAVNTLTGTIALNTQGNFGFTVKYIDGFSPPNYKRVNSVQAGLVLKY